MSRPGYLNVYITEPRQAWLDGLCERLELEPSHKNYLVAMDAALAAMVAGVMEAEPYGDAYLVITDKETGEILHDERPWSPAVTRWPGQKGEKDGKV
jgi:hypothetical protein